MEYIKNASFIGKRTIKEILKKNFKEPTICMTVCRPSQKARLNFSTMPP
ncbi:hypothetical protein MTBBW1_2170007 [Desulfamplus magnetovallimortis]|uniref:Uncharacterized protein n=1 Tax=Desulfamplus magnetovallimortis TaxID=1246637 RepID=A0A1W1HCR6_9BACT|nr:hypothetical protein MTBBW1_2170007 [Desulfamplus magnetovallimortis]